MDKPDSSPLISPETEAEIRVGVMHIFEAYFAEPNTQETWSKIRDHICDFLSELWKEGKLLGSNPERAFRVHVGVGSETAKDDINQGQVRVRISLPDESAAYTDIVIP